MAKILVTGGAGFIGSHLSGYHLQKGDQVWVVDNLSSGSKENIQSYLGNPSFRFDQADLLEWDGLQEAISTSDRIYHMAAIVGQRLVLGHPIRTITHNIEGTRRILEAMEKSKRDTRLLLASTSEVYARTPIGKDGTYKETSEVVFPSGELLQRTYPLSKLVDEAMALSYVHEGKARCTVARLFNTIGTRQTAMYGMVVPNFVNQALNNDPLTVYGTGLQSRSFGSVHDIVQALDLLLGNPESNGQIVNVGNDKETTILDLAKLVIERAKSKSTISYMSYKQAYGVDFVDVERRKPDLNKLYSLTGFRCQWTLAEMIDEIIASKVN